MIQKVGRYSLEVAQEESGGPALKAAEWKCSTQPELCLRQAPGLELETVPKALISLLPLGGTAECPTLTTDGSEARRLSNLICLAFDL